MSMSMNKLPPRYAVSDWATSNKLVSLNAERIRDSSHTIRQEARKLRNETDSHTRWTQHDSNTKLENRIDDINEWKESLERCLQETDKEIEDLQTEKKNLEVALEAKQMPLNVALECLMLREEREGIDLVRDNVEHQLHKEVEVIEGIKALLQQKITEAFEQLCLLEEARHQLHCDVTDKLDALQIDGECFQLNNESKDIDFQTNPTRTVKGSVTPETWNAFSQYNKHKGEAEMKTSQRLREAIFATLEKTRNDLNAQHRATNYEYRKRVQETEQAKNELEWQQKNTQDEIVTMEQDITALREAIDIKMAPMKVAQTRLEKRTHRKNVELCRDIPQYQLCHEVAEIDGSVRALSEKHNVAETALQSLLQDLARIDDDLAIKTKSLALDQECMQVRDRLNSGDVIESDKVAENTAETALPSKLNDLSITERTVREKPTTLKETNNNNMQIFQQGTPTPQTSLLQSTYNFDFDDTKSKRLGDLQRTVGNRSVSRPVKEVVFA